MMLMMMMMMVLVLEHYDDDGTPESSHSTLGVVACCIIDSHQMAIFSSIILIVIKLFRPAMYVRMAHLTTSRIQTIHVHGCGLPPIHILNYKYDVSEIHLQNNIK